MKIEHAVGTTRSKAARAHLRNRLLNRFADLEAERALIQYQAPDEVEIVEIVARAALMPPQSLAQLQTLEDGAKRVPPHKLD